MLSGFRPLALLLCLIGFCTPALSQGARIDFGGLRQDTSQPVEVTADQLAVDQGDGSATFSGNVLVGQGEMRLSATTVRVEYGEGNNEIRRLHASGGVMLASPTDAAEAADAIYTIASGEVVMTGNVLLTQGKSAISGQKLVINLKSGIGTMQGRVQTVFQPGGSAP